MLFWYHDKSSGIYWNDNICLQAPKMSINYVYNCLTPINDQFVLALGGVYLGSNRQLVEMFDVFSRSPCWIPMMDMLIRRGDLGVGTLDNCVYAVSRNNILHILSYKYICYNY